MRLEYTGYYFRTFCAGICAEFLTFRNSSHNLGYKWSVFHCINISLLVTFVSNGESGGTGVLLSGAGEGERAGEGEGAGEGPEKSKKKKLNLK